MNRMRLPKLRYALIMGGLLGLIGPIVVLIYVVSRNIIFPPDWVLLLWPSLIKFYGAANDRYNSFAVLSLAVVTNIVIYVFAAAILWCIAWVVRGWRESLRDGTTI